MIAVVDASILIDHVRGRQSATELLDQVVARGDALWSVSLVRTEVLAGMRSSEEVATRRLLGTIEWLDVTVDLADAAGALASTYQRSHSGIDVVDYVLAAATVSLGAELLTLNVRHFPMIEGLERPY